jgi:hypothetical protein
VINLAVLKQRMLAVDPGSAAFYLSKGIGDQVPILCQLSNFARLHGCNVTLFSKGNTLSTDLVNLFPSLRGRHVPLPVEFFEGYSDDEMIYALCDATVPGADKLFSTFRQRSEYNPVYLRWIVSNQSRYNWFRIAWHYLGVAPDERPEYVQLPDAPEVPAAGDFVILCPRAVTVDQLPVELWTSLASRVMQMGYRCVVNAPISSRSDSVVFEQSQATYSLDRLQEIGCEFFQGSMAELLALAKKARHTYLIRTGMADLFSLTEGLSYSVLYPPGFAHIDKYLTLDYDGAASKPKFEITVRRADDIVDLDQLTCVLTG